jgi:hypothetical protein
MAAVVGAGIALALSVVVTFADAATAVVAPMLIGAFVLVVVAHRMFPGAHDPILRRTVFRWMFVALVAHVVVGLAVTENFGLRNYLATDSFTYHDTAVAIVRHWTMGFPNPGLPFGKEGFFYELAILYRVFGTHLASGVVVNCVFAALLVPVVTDTTRRLAGHDAARTAAVLVVVLPGLLLWTSMLMREAPTILLIAVATNAAVRLSDRLTVPAAAALSVSLALLFLFRGFVAPLVAAGLIAAISLSRRHVVAGLSTGLSAASLLAVLVVGAGVGYSGFHGIVSSNLEQANAVRQDAAATAASGFAVSSDISTPQHALAYVPRGVTNFSLGPAPWQVRGVRQVPALVDALVWWLLLRYLWRGWFVTKRHKGRSAFVVLLPAVLLIVFLGLIAANFGLIVRERQQVVVIVIPLIAAGLAHRRMAPTWAADRDDSRSATPA